MFKFLVLSFIINLYAFSNVFTALLYSEPIFMHKKYVQFNKKTRYFKKFSEDNVNSVMIFLDNFGKFKSWHEFKTACNLNQKFYFQWLQLIDAIPKAWKKIFQININNNG